MKILSNTTNNLRRKLQICIKLQKCMNFISFFSDIILIDLNIKFFYKIFYILKNYSFFKYNSLLNMFCSNSYDLNTFFIYYYLVSFKYNDRIFIRIKTPKNLIVPSLISFYPSSNWLEREIWDFFGIFFQNHNDLRRILTDYGFDGNPLLKNYPVVGFFECMYDLSLKSVVYVILEQSQEIRWYKFQSPWDKSFFFYDK